MPSRRIIPREFTYPKIKTAPLLDFTVHLYCESMTDFGSQFGLRAPLITRGIFRGVEADVMVVTSLKCLIDFDLLFSLSRIIQVDQLCLIENGYNHSRKILRRLKIRVLLDRKMKDKK